MISSNPIASTIIMIFGLQAIVLIILLISKRPITTTRFFLALLLFFFALMTVNIAVGNFLIATNRIHLFTYFQLELLFGIGPSLYFFSKSITDPDYRFSRTEFVHFIPVIIEFIYFRSNIYRIGIERRLVLYQKYSSIYQSTLDNYTIAYLILQWIAIISIMIYIYLSLRLLFRYNQWIKTRFSNLKNKSLGWLQIPVIFYSGFWLAWTILRTIDTFAFQNTLKEVYFLPSIIGLSIITCWIGFKGYVKSQTEAKGFLSSLVKIDSKKSNPQKAEILVGIMENQKPYLNPELDLTKLSEYATMSPKMLSQVINQDLKTNFYEFINNYRVEEFKKQVLRKDTDKFSLLGIAFECGFNSKSTFNHIFKKFTGQTPKEYYNQCKNKSERKHSDDC